MIRLCVAILALLSLLWIAPNPVHAEHPGRPMAQQGPLRLLCWEAGPHADHQLILQGLAEGLKELGLIQTGPVPEPVDNSTAPMWGWLLFR